VTSGPQQQQRGRVGGWHARGVKSVQGVRATRDHGGRLAPLAAEPRTYGPRSVFDTLVVHTVNDGCGRHGRLAYVEHPAWEAAARPGT